jgi:hypothetical protein
VHPPDSTVMLQHIGPRKKLPIRGMRPPTSPEP